MSDTLRYGDYIGSVEYSEADDLLFGRILGISGSVSYDGEDIHSLRRGFEEAVDDYIDFCDELGKKPEISFDGRLAVQVSPDLHRKVVGFARQRNQPVNQLVEEALSRFVLQ